MGERAVDFKGVPTRLYEGRFNELLLYGHRGTLSLKPPEPNAARLRIVEDDDTDTYRSIQTGVMAFGEGCFKAIRNPLAHLAPEEIDLDEDDALEHLAALSLFARWIDGATVLEG